MKRKLHLARSNRLTLVAAIAVSPLALAASVAWAQQGGTSPAAPPSPPTAAGGTSTSTTTTFVPFGLPAPGTDLESHLPSSSHASTDTSRSTDGFDLNKAGAGSGTASNQNGQAVMEGYGVPESHTVRRGDTLWGLSGQYFKTPYNWPRLWAENPQIQNPHWIYPGDRVRLRAPDTQNKIGRASLRGVPPNTVFLRDLGWVDDPDKDTWGELVGAPDDQMILSDQDEVYVQLDDDVKVNLGDELTIFRVIRTMRGEDADADGELVSVRGTVRIDKWNPKTHLARAKIVEALDTIERGALIGPVSRKFDVVPAARNEKYVEARILTALYPHAFFGGNQVLFLDRGAKDGVKPGNRFLAVRRGDRWVEGLANASKWAADRQLIEDDRYGQHDTVKTDGPMDLYPDELYAEIRVLSVRDHTCFAIVTESAFEVERDAVLVMKKGF
jgi:hypothetical protein